MMMDDSKGGSNYEKEKKNMSPWVELECKGLVCLIHNKLITCLSSCRISDDQKDSLTTKTSNQLKKSSKET
uniref:Ovule protein n=1 Tax=Romanomermis culicivorax TaxID=13658 RepID=A0A915HGJ1_ROMCU